MKAVGELQQEIKRSIETRAGFAVRDVHTFMRAKSSEDLRKISNDFADLGGGNFLSAMAGIVLLEALAITLACLQDKRSVWTAADVRSIKELREEFCKTHGVSKTKLSDLGLQTPREGTPKNLEATILALEGQIRENLGIDLGYKVASQHIPNLWGVMRNNLAHRLAPGWGTAAGSVNPGWLSASSDLATDHAWFRKFNSPAFDRHDSGTVYVAGEFLVLSYLPRISAWLCNQIDVCHDLESLQLAAVNNLVSLD